MKLQRREKILAAVTAGLVALSAGWILFFSGGSLSYAELSRQRDDLVTQVNRKEMAVKKAAQAARRLAEWQHRALPSDATDARALYQTWLRELAERFQFHQLNVDASASGQQSQRNTFTLFAFTLHGRTNLVKLVEFLYAFSSAGHLHQIRSIDVKPVENSPELDVSLTVEAMSLPGADRTNKLTTAQNKTLPRAKLADYSKTIVGRNVFGPFRPAGNAMGMGADAAQTTFVTAIVGGDRGEVWLIERTSGRDWKLHEGEHLQAGSLQGTIKTIGTSDVTIDVDGHLRRYRCGDQLRGGEEVREPGPADPPHRGTVDLPPRTKREESKPLR
jgi:hypothetical protein